MMDSTVLNPPHTVLETLDTFKRKINPGLVEIVDRAH
jgi:hypothetical protein